MEKVILLRFGELYLKGKNRSYFESVLISNIKQTLKGFSYTFSKTSGRYLVENFDENQTSILTNKLQKVFGLVSLSVANKCKTDKETIINFIKTINLNGKSFRVSVKRADKTFAMNSYEFERELGGIILQNNPNSKVDLTKFDTEVFVDIRENGSSYIFDKKIVCVGGMPLGTGGKGLLMLSGGIDSPVAGYMVAKRGMSLVALHFHSYPYTSEAAKQKVISLGKKMCDYTGKLKIIMFPFTEIQEAIHKHCASEFMITIMRRIMMKIAKEMCDKYNCKAIITGENLGQVASQTVESLTVTNFSQTTYPVFRPLLAFDKFEIVDIAKRMDTYETSILPYEDCCTVFLPKNPVIKPSMQKTEREESKLDVESLIKNAMEKIEIVEC